MDKQETPESLLSFFTALDPGDQDQAQCQIHYGCLCVLRKGRLAAEMLVGAQQNAGGSEAGPAAESAAVDAGRLALAAELATEKTKRQELLRQNLKLVDENIKLKDKIKLLQRQVNRLYDNQEMRALERSLQPAAERTGNDEEKNIARMIAELDGAARVGGGLENKTAPAGAGVEGAAPPQGVPPGGAGTETGTAEPGATVQG